MTTTTLSAVNNQIQTLLYKGAQILYDKYLTQSKLPLHSAQIASSSLIQSFNIAYHPHSQPKKIKIEKFANNLPFQSLSIGNVKLRPQSELANKYSHKKKEALSFSISKKLSQENKNSKNNQTISLNTNKLYQSSKPNYPIKYQCDKFDQYKTIEQSYRSQKYERDRMRAIVDKQIRIKNQKLDYRRKQLQQKYTNLIENSNSFTYDYDSVQLIPKSLQNEKKAKNKIGLEKRLIALKYQTLDLQINSKEPQIKNIVGRKVGVLVNKFKKRQRMTNKQYNNNDHRQYSTIPFMALTEGIKVVQTDMNVIAVRHKSPQPSKDQFIKLSKEKRFRSFMPSSRNSQRVNNPQSMTFYSLHNTLDLSRPGTCNATSGKQTAATGATTRSILWRPHTTQGNHRMKINKELVQQMIM